ncbi:MAG: hypothetical protein HY675_06235 [Chloroflexi bacterium]|nr:hypothetical protein [Chloroflexota bacterium]
MPETIYFARPGPDNTDDTIAAVARRALELDISTVVVASHEGRVGLQVASTMKGLSVVVVTHSSGYKEPNTQQLPDEIRRELQEMGAQVLTCHHAFAGINYAVRKRFGTYLPDDYIAHTLRLFGVGVKVAVEVSLMAASAGLIRTDREIISIAGTGKGADTALVLQPTTVHKFFDLRVKEIICKPRL